MPKIIDHEARRKELARAAWRVIRRHGLEGATVRNVAKEAGMSVGSLRHYFKSQSELLAFSMRLISERVEKRIFQLQEQGLTGDIRADVTRMLEEVLPLDEERVSESIVWLGFVSRALVDPALAPLSAEVHESMLRFMRMLAEALLALLPDRTGLDAELEARRLQALLDGIVVHALGNPDSVTPETIRRILAYHLDQMLQRPLGTR